jgi:hypothetical protein
VSELALILSAICAASVALIHGAAAGVGVLSIGELGVVPKGVGVVSAIVRMILNKICFIIRSMLLFVKFNILDMLLLELSKKHKESINMVHEYSWI